MKFSRRYNTYNITDRNKHMQDTAASEFSFQSHVSSDRLQQSDNSISTTQSVRKELKGCFSFRTQ